MPDFEYDVVVVGAGYAGVTSARDLRDRGRSVLLLEGGERIGGRAYRREFAGQPGVNIENGGAYIDLEKHHNVRREVERYQVPLVIPSYAPTSAHFYTGGERRSLPVEIADLWALEKVAVHMANAAARLSSGAPLHEQDIADLDVSAEEFFGPLGALPQSMHDLIYSLIGGHEGADPDSTSMLWLLSLIAGGGGSPFQYFMFGEASHTRMFANGTRDLLDRMVSDSDVEVRLSSRVVAVTSDDSAVAVRTEDGSTIRAGACVMAAPTNVLRHIDFNPSLGAAQRRVVARNHPGRAIKIHMIVENLSSVPLCMGMGALVAVMPIAELEGGRSLLVGFGTEFIDPLDPRDRAAVEQALRVYLPEVEVIAVDGHDWGGDPLFDGTYRVDRPGDGQSLGAVMSASAGRVTFAGADIEQGLFRSTFEGAISSGVRAATEADVLLS